MLSGHSEIVKLTCNAHPAEPSSGSPASANRCYPLSMNSRAPLAVAICELLCGLNPFWRKRMSLALRSLRLDLPSQEITSRDRDWPWFTREYAEAMARR